MWRGKTHNRAGLSRSAKLFCSRRCNLLVLAKLRDKRVEVPCGWHLCKKKVLRKQSEAKNFESAYCHQEHYFLTMRRRIHLKKDAEKRAAEAANVGLLYCGACRDITEHLTPRDARAKCNTCGATRPQGGSGMSSSETNSIKHIEKQLARSGA